MSEQTFDIVVIGTGPGGEGASMQATKLGKTVAVVERHEQIGGGCTHWGTIPSKALRHAIFQATTLFHSKLFRESGLSSIPDFPALRRTAGSVIEKQVDMPLKKWSLKKFGKRLQKIRKACEGLRNLWPKNADFMAKNADSLAPP